MVRYYSGLSLSFSKDRLPAIAGIAQRMADFSNDQYLAGMWKSTLRESLGWTCLEQQTHPKQRPEENPSPSWSWASVGGAVDLWWLNDRSHPDATCYITDVYAYCATVDGTDFGIVLYGSLRLTGMLTHTMLSLDSSQIRGGFSLEAFDRPLGPTRVVWKSWVYPDFDITQQQSYPMEVCCLWLYAIGRKQYLGIVLRAVGAKYQRIGAFQLIAIEGYIPEGSKPWRQFNATRTRLEII